MLGAGPRLAPGFDLRPVGHEAPQPRDVLVVDAIDLIDAELAGLAPLEVAPAAAPTAEAARPAATGAVPTGPVPARSIAARAVAEPAAAGPLPGRAFRPIAARALWSSPPLLHSTSLLPAPLHRAVLL